MLGRGVAVSPVVTVEPRRRKFHKAITLSMPAPRAHSQGMINQYSGNAPTLRLLCSITGTYEGTLCVPMVLNLNLFRFDLTPLPFSTYLSLCLYLYHLLLCTISSVLLTMNLSVTYLLPTNTYLSEHSAHCFAPDLCLYLSDFKSIII